MGSPPISPAPAVGISKRSQISTTTSPRWCMESFSRLSAILHSQKRSPRRCSSRCGVSLRGTNRAKDQYEHGPQRSRTAAPSIASDPSRRHATGKTVKPTSESSRSRRRVRRGLLGPSSGPQGAVKSDSHPAASRRACVLRRTHLPRSRRLVERRRSHTQVKNPRWHDSPAR